MRLKGKVAIITGGGSGIGRASAVLFAQEGARVIVADIDAKGGEETVAFIREAGGNAEFVCVDVSSNADAQRLCDFTMEQYGSINVLVNNAGVSGRRLGDGPVHECPPEVWEQVLAINLKGAYLCSRYAIPHMMEAGGGCIVNVSSIVALVGGGETFNSHAYAASKGGIISLTRAMATYYARYRIRVNCICPGVVETPMSLRAQTSPEVLEVVSRMQPIKGGLGKPEEVASAILFLASDESSFITGTVLPVDGGWTAQ